MTFLLLAIQSSVCVLAVWSVKRMGIITCKLYITGYRLSEILMISPGFRQGGCKGLVARLGPTRRRHLHWIKVSRRSEFHVT
jgi:hypothetical protein